MGRLRSPVIPILLKGRKTFWTNALVDTGADTSVLTKKVAEILELDLSAKPQKVNGIGGETEAVLTELTIIFETPHKTYKYQVPVFVVTDETVDFPMLLGRAGFFKHFKITFDESKEKVFLKPRPE